MRSGAGLTSCRSYTAEPLHHPYIIPTRMTGLWPLNSNLAERTEPEVVEFEDLLAPNEAMVLLEAARFTAEQYLGLLLMGGWLCKKVNKGQATYWLA